MGRKAGILGALLVLGLIGLVVAGCGGGSSSTTTSGSSPGSSSEFIVPGQKNPIAQFGKEADSEELEEASEILEENLKARQEGDWGGQCASLSLRITVKVEKRSAAFQGTKGGCAKSVKAEAEPLSATAAARKNTLTGPVSVLRVEGKKGYALYHGTGGKNYAMLMEKEDGKWKVASLATTELPVPPKSSKPEE